MKVRIRQECKSAMQSAPKHFDGWVIEYPPAGRYQDSIMGWTSTSSPEVAELKLKFKTLGQAIDYAKSNGLGYEVINTHEMKQKPARPYVKIYS